MNQPAIHQRLLCLAATIAPVVAAAGCQSTYRPDYAPVPVHVAHADEALLLRDWPLTVALYASGDVVAGPTNSAREWRVGEPGDFDYERRQRLGIVIEPLVALGTLVTLPVSLVLDPPTEQRTYQGVIIEPTYTAAVPASEVLRETAYGRRELSRDAAAAESAPPEAPGEPSLSGQRQESAAPSTGGGGAGGAGGAGSDGP